MPSPITPYLDQFNRTDENPAAGWTQISGVANSLKVLTNKLRSVGTSPAYGGAYLPTSSFSGGNVEYYWQVGDSPVVGWTEDWFYLISDSGAQSPIRFGFINGYCLRGAYPAANQMQVQRWDASTPTDIGSPAAWTWAADDLLWVQVLDGTHRVYAKHTADPDYTLVTSFTDATYTSGVWGWRSQSGSDANPGTVDNLGGGVINTATVAWFLA